MTRIPASTTTDGRDASLALAEVMTQITGKEQELVTQFARDALDDGGDTWGVKVVNGRPIAPHVTRFVASVTRKAA